MAKAKKKWGVEFAGVDNYLKRLEALSGEAPKKAVTRALQKSQQIVADKAARAMIPHKQTGKTAGAIITDGAVEWAGTTASISVGFDIDNGGLPSIFLMYGTKSKTGEKLIKADTTLKAAVFGAATKREVLEAQELAFDEIFKEFA